MTDKRTHGPCTCGQRHADPAVSCAPECASLDPSKQEPDALTRLERWIRTQEGHIVSESDVYAAISLIYEARKEQRREFSRGSNEGLEWAASDFDELACDVADRCQHEACARLRRFAARIRGFKVSES